MKNSLWKVAIYVVVIITGMLALPNVLSDRMLAQLPSALPHQRVSLGLDLRGGSHLVLEVDRDSLVTEWLQNLQQDVRSTLEKSQITMPLFGGHKAPSRFVSRILPRCSRRSAS